ncbi:MAG: superoxide dismutase [Anaerolineae bacterium]|nr:superoxide dismutase [Anaerolineae bacterium]
MGKHELPPLPYAYDALEPYIDEQTIHVHHGKHHQTYVNNLNAALEGYPDLQTKTIEDLLRDLSAIPESARAGVRNHGGGHLNHVMFWQNMGPGGGGEPQGKLGDAIKSTFGSFEAFKEQFTKAAMGRFGSGWAWLCLEKGGKLAVLNTPNQDTPLSDGMVPLLTLDVWEHAYYLKYQNRRADFVEAWWNIVNWDDVSSRFEAASK